MKTTQKFSIIIYFLTQSVLGWGMYERSIYLSKKCMKDQLKRSIRKDMYARTHLLFSHRKKTHTHAQTYNTQPSIINRSVVYMKLHVLHPLAKNGCCFKEQVSLAITILPIVDFLNVGVQHCITLKQPEENVSFEQHLQGPFSAPHHLFAEQSILYQTTYYW